MLFFIATILSFRIMLLPVNWLTSQGLLRSQPAWTAAQHWAVFLAVLLTSLVASRIEHRPLGSYGLPWKGALRLRFWEGIVWGLGGITLLMYLLYTSGGVSFTVDLRGRQALSFGAVWAASILGLGFFKEYLIRGYLQFTLTRSIGFWPAAVLLTFLFTLESLLGSANRHIVILASSITYCFVVCLTLRRTGNLWFAIGLYVGLKWSMIYLYGFGAAFPTSIPPQGAFLRPVVYGPDYLTGGEYGFDGSILTLALMALLLVGVHLRFPEARYPSDSQSDVYAAKIGVRSGKKKLLED